MPRGSKPGEHRVGRHADLFLYNHNTHKTAEEVCKCAPNASAVHGRSLIETAVSQPSYQLHVPYSHGLIFSLGDYTCVRCCFSVRQFCRPRSRPRLSQQHRCRDPTMWSCLWQMACASVWWMTIPLLPWRKLRAMA